MFSFGLLALVGVCACVAVQAQNASPSLGVFEGQSEVGHVLHEGSAQYDAADETYTVSGSGDNMWFATDEFHFLWKKISAKDVTLSADLNIVSADGDGHRKGLLMIRQSLDTDSPYVDAARHGDGLTSLQFRDAKGAVTREVESNISGPTKLRLEKQGKRFYLWVAGDDGDLQFSGGSASVELHAPFYVGIGVCAHQKDSLVKVAFSNLNLSTKITSPKARYSTVETVLQSADARTGYVSAQHLTSPGWSLDGRTLTFKAEGKPGQAPFTPLKTAAPVGAPVSADAGDRFVYFAPNKDGSSQIWRKPSNGSGDPEQLTSSGFNNTAPHLSPDGKNLVFISYPKASKKLRQNQEITLQMLSLTDKKIKPLATFVGGPGSLGSQPWSPDGRRVVFISYQAIR